MITRIRKAMDEKEQGFTLIELLVVIIILGILAAIAIPIFLNQRTRAVDAAARADVSTVAKQVATYFVDEDAVPTLAIAGDSYTLTPPGGTAQVLGPVSRDTFTAITLTPATADAATFVVTLTYTGGTVDGTATLSYSAVTGLGEPTAAGAPAGG